MSKAFFEYSVKDRRDALGFAADRVSRPAPILEKDIMVVWTLGVLYGSEIGESLSFKGGTSLSKAYNLIDRFSEDIDITYDIRRFLPDFDISEDGIPPSKSKGRKWTEEVREKLPKWISEDLIPLIDAAAERDGIGIKFRQESKERLYLDYASLHPSTSSYIKPAVMLEFGARSTGEPVVEKTVICDCASILNQMVLPTAKVRAMTVGRTFWEKITAAHVYCVQESLKGERFSRHWHDLHYIMNSAYYEDSVNDQEVADKVATHKSFFFAERDKASNWVDYSAAVHGQIRVVPEGDALRALKEDYAQMQNSGMTSSDAPSFEILMESCSAIEARINTPKSKKTLNSSL